MAKLFNYGSLELYDTFQTLYSLLLLVEMCFNITTYIHSYVYSKVCTYVCYVQPVAIGAHVHTYNHS